MEYRRENINTGGKHRQKLDKGGSRSYNGYMT